MNLRVNLIVASCVLIASCKNTSSAIAVSLTGAGSQLTRDSNVATDPNANTAPIAVGDTVGVPYNLAQNIGLTAHDAENNSLTYIILQAPKHGSLSGEAPHLSFTPASGYSGEDSFSFIVSDGTLFSNSATVTISVLANPLTSLSYSRNPAVYTKGAAITPNTPTFPNGTINVYSVSPTLPAGLSLNSSTGIISGVPTAATPSRTYTVTGTLASGSTTATLVLSVAPPPNAPPVALDASIQGTLNTAKSIKLSANDANGDWLTYAVKANPTHGQLSGTAPNLVYTPVQNFEGADSFTFTASDGQVISNTATILIQIGAMKVFEVYKVNADTTLSLQPLPLVLAIDAGTYVADPIAKYKYDSTYVLKNSSSSIDLTLDSTALINCTNPHLSVNLPGKIAPLASASFSGRMTDYWALADRVFNGTCTATYMNSANNSEKFTLQIPLKGTLYTPRSPTAAILINVDVHILAKDAGTLAAPLSSADSIVSALNKYFVKDGTSVFTFAKGNVSTLVDAARYDLDTEAAKLEALTTFTTNNANRYTLNVFIVNSLPSSIAGSGWVGTGLGGTNPPAFLLAASFVSTYDGQTAVHETGHNMYLDHSTLAWGVTDSVCNLDAHYPNDRTKANENIMYPYLGNGTNFFSIGYEKPVEDILDCWRYHSYLTLTYLRDP